MSRYKTYQYIENLSEVVGKEVTLRGWVFNKTGKGKLQFIILRDGTGIARIRSPSRPFRSKARLRY